MTNKIEIQDTLAMFRRFRRMCIMEMHKAHQIEKEALNNNNYHRADAAWNEWRIERHKKWQWNHAIEELNYQRMIQSRG